MIQKKKQTKFNLKNQKIILIFGVIWCHLMYIHINCSQYINYSLHFLMFLFLIFCSFVSNQSLRLDTVLFISFVKFYISPNVFFSSFFFIECLLGGSSHLNSPINKPFHLELLGNGQAQARSTNGKIKSEA